MRRVPGGDRPVHPVSEALGAGDTDDLGALAQLVGQLAAPRLVHGQPLAQLREVGDVIPHVLRADGHVGRDVDLGHQRLGPPRKRLPIRRPATSSARATSRPPKLTAFGTRPGTTLRLPSTIPPMACSATSCGDTCASGMLNRSALAISPHSVGTGPGHSTVTETPVPCSSSCTASEKVCTKAFVAEYTAMKGIGWNPAIEAILSTAPAPRSIIPGSAAWVSSISASELRTTSSLSRSTGRV